MFSRWLKQSLHALLLAGQIAFAAEQPVVTTKMVTYPLITAPLEVDRPQLFVVLSPRFPDLPNWQIKPLNSSFSFFDNAETDYEELQKEITNPTKNTLLQLDQFLNKHPESPLTSNARFWKSVFFAKQKKWAQAQELLQHTSLSTPDFPYNSQAQYLQAWIAAKQDQLETALSIAKQLPPSIEQAELLLHLLITTKQTAKAIETAQKLIVTYPNTPHFFEHLMTLAGLAHRQQEYPLVSQLFEDYQNVFYHHPEFVDFLLIALQSSTQAKSWEEAQQQLALLEQHGSQNDIMISQWHLFLSLERDRIASVAKQIAELPEHQDEQAQFVVSYLLEKNDGEAILQLQRLLQTEKIFIIQFTAATVLQHQRKFEQAVTQYRQIQEIPQPWKEVTLWQQAQLALQQNQWPQAKQQLQELTTQFQESSRLSEYFFWYGVALSEEGSPKSAITLRQVTKPPFHQWAFLHQGLFYYEQQQYAKASRSLRVAIRHLIKPELKETAQLFLAKNTFAQKQFQQSLQVLSEIPQSSPLSEEVLVLKAQILIQQGQPHDAQQLLAEALQTKPSFQLAQLRLDLLIDLGDYDSVEKLAPTYLSYAETPNQTSQIHAHQADAAWKQNKQEQAYHAYQQAMHYETPWNPTHHYRTVQLAYDLKKTKDFLEQSQAFLTKSTSQTPHHRKVLTLLGNHHLQHNDYSAAKRYWKPLIEEYQDELKGSLPPSEKNQRLLQMAEIYNRLRQPEEAQSALKQINLGEITSEEKHYQLWKETAYAAYHQESYDVALANYLKLIYLNKNLLLEERFDILTAIAYCYQQQNQFQEAITIYQKMLKDFPQSPFQNKIKEWLTQLHSS